MRLYVGCSLTHAPEEFRDDVASLKDELRKNFEILDFVGLASGTAHDVYQWDIHNCIATCDILLAVCDFPSLGLGYEMATAVEKLSKPTLAVAQDDSKVGRIMLGIEQPHYTFTRYTHMSDILELIRAFAKEHNQSV